jgi:acyl-CoA reductase-like NAD-dependent aldehyde dehydrogenase
VEAANKAFYKGPWANTGGYERGRVLNRLADLIEKHKEELAKLEGIFFLLQSCYLLPLSFG